MFWVYVFAYILWVYVGKEYVRIRMCVYVVSIRVVKSMCVYAHT